MYNPNLDGQKLPFRIENDRIVDEKIGSAWNMLGEAFEDVLAEKRLEPVVHTNHFWFAWSDSSPIRPVDVRVLRFLNRALVRHSWIR